MLNNRQIKYIETLPSEKAEEIVHIFPYDSKSKKVMGQLEEQIKEKLPKVNVIFHGSSALGIAGIKDIDVAVISSGEFTTEQSSLTELFGAPSEFYKDRYTFWEFEKDGFEIELTLNKDTNDYQIKEHLETFEKLKNNKFLRDKYEEVKLSMNGKTFKEYMTKKLEFLESIQ